MTSSPISLLWPPDQRSGGPHPTLSRLNTACLNDLDLERTITELAEGHGFAPRIRQIIIDMVVDPAVIAYRQAVLADLIDIPGLADQFRDLLPSINAINQFNYLSSPDQSPLHEVVWRVGQLESYVDVITGLNRAFDHAGKRLRSEALTRLRDLAASIQADDTFISLQAQLPDLVEQVRSISSITIGVNLDAHLRPDEAVLLAVNSRKFKGESASLLSALFGPSAANADWEGIAPLHAAFPRGSAGFFGPPGGQPPDPTLHPLFRDLAEIVKRTTRPLASALQRYVRLNVQALNDLGAEIAFFLGGARLADLLRARGLPVCRPQIAPVEERVCFIENSYNVNLALRVIERNRNPQDLSDTVIANDVHFSAEAGRIFVLTGPNHGGKTTYTQAVGLAQILAQAGLFVPGTRATISPVDGIYTHFPVEEKPDSHAGRLGEEAQRLNTIFASATAHSLVLLNESLSSTSPGESLYLARDMVRILRRMGARVIFATHLHELAAGVDALNDETPGDSRISSLVAQVAAVPHPSDNGHEDTSAIRQTYRIVPGPPRGHSYAREIAAQYGISYDQLIALLRDRGLVDED